MSDELPEPGEEKLAGDPAGGVGAPGVGAPAGAAGAAEGAAPEAGGAAGAAGGGEVAGGEAPGLVLVGEAGAARRLSGVYRRRYEDYGAEVYGCDAKTIKRWVRKGKQAQPLDLPPLDEPGQMADWWRRISPRYPVPARLLELACQAPGKTGAVATPTREGRAVGIGASDEKKRGSAREGGEAEASEEGPGLSAPVLLEQLTLGAGEEVQMAARLVVAMYARVDEAYKKGNDAEILKWQPKVERAWEMLRKAQDSDQKRRVKSRELVPREAVMADLTEAVEMLRMMRRNMRKRVAERLTDLPAELLERVMEAVEEVRAREDRVFENLHSLKGEDLGEILAA